MEDNGQTPDKGQILVTEATGGVGGLAINMLSGLELTRKHDALEYLKFLGASEVLLGDEIVMGNRPIEKDLWGRAINAVGGVVLSWLTRTVKPLVISQP